ncbi:DNA-directed RNA polymerase III subunit Rpc5 [Globomyces pollinis-pini]|nr:DNA-directed RNA polymerase III subunit Rpc5 [Globomyces pollinis-pini]
MLEYECDVYFNSELDDLYLLQFPTKPDPFQLDNFPKHGRLKPDHFQIELDLDLNTRGAYYDMDKAAELKMGLDSESHNDIVDKIKYNSFKVPMNSRYLIGIKNEDGLHLTQLKNIIQMRPYLDYIDQKAEKEKELKNSNDKEEDAKAIQMSFELEDLESTRKASAAKLRRAMEDEPWIPLQVHLPNSDLSEQMKNSLTFMDLEDNSNALDQTPAQYLDKICSMGVQ